MNTTEACQANTLLRCLLGDVADGKAVTSAEAQMAAFYLAGRAGLALAAGIGSEELQRRWPQRREAVDKKRHDRLVDLVRQFAAMVKEEEIRIVPRNGSALRGRELFHAIQTALKQEP